jgi:hypothetical protein
VCYEATQSDQLAKQTQLGVTKFTNYRPRESGLAMNCSIDAIYADFHLVHKVGVEANDRMLALGCCRFHISSTPFLASLERLGRRLKRNFIFSGNETVRLLGVEQFGSGQVIGA